MSNTARKSPSPTGLYEQDFFQWTQEQARLLREKHFASIDIENIAEELETLGRSQKREIENRLNVVLIHLLKWMYQPSRRPRSWISTLREQRRQLAREMTDSPSLRGYPASILAEEYEAARLKASDEADLPLETFPEECPFRIEDVLDADFLPDTAAP
jgi:hypothetical protein